VEAIAKELEIVSWLVLEIKSGHSLLSAIRLGSSTLSESSRRLLKKILRNREQNRPLQELANETCNSMILKELLICIESGLQGDSIYERLEVLLFETERESRVCLQSFIEILPYKLLLPLLMLQLPAFLILILVPSVRYFAESSL